MAQCQKYSKTATEVEKKVTTFWKNIHLEKFQPYDHQLKIKDLVTYFSVVGEEFLQVVVFKDGQHLLVAASHRAVPLTLDLFQRLEEVEAHQRVTPFNLQLALDGFNVLEVFLQDAGNFCINHTDHDVSSHIRAAF